MIYDKLNTNHTHINTVMHKDLIHFKTITESASVMIYRIKLLTSASIKLICLFDEKVFSNAEDDLKQSFIIDWGDGVICSVFTENINTGTYNKNSNLILTHDYDVPINSEIEVVIMSEYESLCPISLDDDVDGIAVLSIGGVLAPVSKPIESRIREHIARHLLAIIDYKPIIGDGFLSMYEHLNFNRYFSKCTKLFQVDDGFFGYECSKVESTVELFEGCSSLTSVPSLYGFKVLSNVESMFENCDMRSVGNMFSHIPISKASYLFKNNINLSYVNYENFSGRINLSAVGIFSGCVNLINSVVDELFRGTLFEKNGIMKMYSDIPNLKIYSNTIDTYKNYGNLSGFIRNSYTGVFSKGFIENLNIYNGDDAFSVDTLSSYSNDRVTDNSITLKSDDGNVSIINFIKNRNMEIMSSPFKMVDIVNLDYTDCFVGNRSLYNDRQIFKNHYKSDMRSGLDSIFATLKYNVSILKSNAILKFSTIYNKFNTLLPELEAQINIYIKDTLVVSYNEHDLIELMDSDGFIELSTNYSGSVDITLEYSHCAPFTLTYKDKVDKETYVIDRVDIELFPTDLAYTGLYGLELYSATEVTGNFFRLFYDRLNTEYFWNSNEWMDGFFAYLTENTVSIDNDIFINIENLGKITELRNLFKYPYLDHGRDVFNSDYYKAINPFRSISGELFRKFYYVNSVSEWFNQDDILIDISGYNINSIFSSMSDLIRVDKVLNQCEHNVFSDDARISWSNNRKVEEVVSWIGRANYLAVDLLSCKTLTKVNRFHRERMITGLSKEQIEDRLWMDFSDSPSDDIDLTEMFYGEVFEIPDMFIRNVRGTLKFNNCFKGSYRFDLDNDGSVFENVNQKYPGDVSGLTFIELEDCLKLEMDGYDGVNSGVTFKLKDKIESNVDVVCRVFIVDPYDEEDEEAEQTFTLVYSDLLKIDDKFSIPSNISMGDSTEPIVELWCRKANIYIDSSESMTVKYLSGRYGSTSWSANGSMLTMYPGLVPINIICEENGGPWRNIMPTNGVINFTDIFRGTVNKELIDYRILITNSASGTEYNMTNAFAYGSIAEFDVRMFEVIGDVVINGTSMFRQNSDENFNFVNLESGPYIFMELLFTKFKTAREMFRHASVPRTLFNHAPFFGCDRNGEVSSSELINASLHAFMSKYGDSSGNKNNIPVERFPLWNNNVNYGSLNDCWDAFINTRYILSEGDHSILPTTNSILKFWAAMRIVDTSPTFNSTVNLKKINDINGISGDRSKFTIEPDHSFIKTELLNSTIRLCYLFSGEFLQVDDKFLIEPFDTSFNSNNISFLEGNNDRPGFRAFKTYAPDTILFRNVKSYTGSSGAKLLQYPNYIEYQNIHLSGNSITFIREELGTNHRFSTYLTVYIKYDTEYEEALWFIVDKNADSYTFDLDTSKIKNNTVSIKIQSTQCFYLVKDSNIDYVERLDGTYRKDLQPRDSEFFNFDVNYYYFIERFGADLWKDVKIKQGDSKFRFGLSGGDSSTNRLLSIEGSPFRTQTHLTTINYLFYKCYKYIPSSEILVGFGNVTYAYNLFNHTLAFKNIHDNILDPLISVIDLGHLFHSIKDIENIPVNLYHNKPNLKYVNNAFEYGSVNSNVRLPKEFWNGVSDSEVRYNYMFKDCTGISRTGPQFLSGDSFRFNSSTQTLGMFSGTNILDVRVDWIREGSLTSSNSIDMFKSCSTYEEQSEFESRYGSQTGVNFKCHESMTYRSSSVNIKGNFKFIDSVQCPDKSVEYVKIVVDSGVYFKTLEEVETSAITTNTSFVEIYSDYAIILESTNVERLEGKFPSKDGSILDIDNFNLGQKYPNLKYIDPLLFSKLINQTDMSYVFRDLRDINIIPINLFTSMVNLVTVDGLYADSKGVLNSLSDITNFIGPSNNINSMDSLFKNVSIKQLGRKSIKLRISGTVNLTDAFSGTNAYIDADVFDGTPSSINVTGMFRACKSLYSIDELTNLPNTGDSLLEVLKSFRPTVSIPNSNSEINLMLLHDEPEASKIVDVVVDWGDDSSNIMVSVRVDSITHISRVIATSGDKNLRIWSSYYGVGVKLKSDSTGSIIKHNGGYIGKFIKSSTGTKIVKQFFKKYMPNSTSISSEMFNCLDPSISDMYLCFSGSNVESIPSSILKRIETADTVMGGLFELAEKIKNIDENTFKDMSITSSSVNIGWMFRKCVELNSIPENIFKPLGDRNITLNSNGGIFKETKIAPPVNIFKHNNLSDTFSLESMFEYSTANFVFNYNVFSKVKKCTNLKRMFSNVSSIDFGNMTVIDSNYLSTDSLVDMTEMFFNYGSNLNNRIDIKVLDFKQNVRLNIEKSLTNVRSIYTEEEIFDYNETVGVSGLISDNRTILRLTVDGTGNLELLKNYNSKYDSKVLIKINGRNHSKHDYTNIGIDVTSGDIVEVITFGDIKDVFYTVNSDTSVSKVKHLDGILNIGSESLVDGKFKTTIVEAFGPYIETISDTFFTNFDIVTNASGLCKGLNNLKTIPNGLIKHFSINTDWNSFFENCASLKLSNENSEMFKLANKGVSFNYMFKNCTSLTYIPPKFFLWNTESNKTFVGTFTNTRVTTIPDDIDEF